MENGKVARIRLNKTELEIIIDALCKDINKTARNEKWERKAELANRLSRYVKFGLTGRTAHVGLVYADKVRC